MAGIFSQAQLITAIRQDADLNVGPNGYISDAEIATRINQEIARLYGMIIGVAEDYFLVPSPAITTTQGNTIYQLPYDAWKGRGIDVSTDPNFVTDVNTAKPFNWKQRNMYNSAMGVYSFLGSTNLRYKFIPGTPLSIKLIPPNAPGNLLFRVWYFPKAPVLVSPATYPQDYQNTYAGNTITAGTLTSTPLGGIDQVFTCVTGGTSSGGVSGVGTGSIGTGGAAVYYFLQVAAPPGLNGFPSNYKITQVTGGTPSVTVSAPSSTGQITITVQTGTDDANRVADLVNASAASSLVFATPNGSSAATGGSVELLGFSVPGISSTLPGITNDGTAQWLYQGPLSCYMQGWDGFNGWEERVITAVAIRCRIKQRKDTQDLMQVLASIDARLQEEFRNVDDDEADFIVDSWYTDGENGNFTGGFGGGWFGILIAGMLAFNALFGSGKTESLLSRVLPANIATWQVFVTHQ